MSGGDRVVCVEVLHVCCVTGKGRIDMKTLVIAVKMVHTHTALLWWSCLEAHLHDTSEFVCVLTISKVRKLLTLQYNIYKYINTNTIQIPLS